MKRPSLKISLPPVRLVLASASPQRKRLLADSGVNFEVIHPGEAEDAIASASTPEALALAKACAKAQVVAGALPPPYPAVVIGVDTLVALGAEIIGKPLDRPDAAAILSRLSGTRHRVISGVCLWPVLAAPKRSLTPKLATESAWVTMRKMSKPEIDTYIASGEADGKAGAYAIQEGGDRFVESLEGSFSNVVGMPMELFAKLLPEALKDWGLELR